MWKLIVANQSDNDFILELPDEPFDEVTKYFKQEIIILSKLSSSSVYCTSAIFPVESYDVTNEKLSIHYHVDSNDEAIRITKIELE